MGFTHEWNGTVLTITSDSGTSSCDLKGDKGDDGVRGAQGATGMIDMDYVYTKDTPPAAQEISYNGVGENLQDALDIITEQVDNNAAVISTQGSDISSLEERASNLEASALVNDEKHTEYDNHLAQLSNTNLLINANYQVWQRGTSFNVPYKGAAYYTCDRFTCYVDYDGYTCLVEKTDKGVKLTPSCTTSWGQHIETNLVGKTITFSMRYITNGIEKFYSYTTTMSNSSDVIRDTVEDGITLVLWFKNGVYLTPQLDFDIPIEIIYEKLEQGSIATPFVPRSYVEELMLCRQYYINTSRTAPILYDYGSNTYSVALDFVEMRTTPTITYAVAYGYNSSGQGTTSINTEVLHTLGSRATIRFTFDSTKVSHETGFMIGIAFDAEIY